MTKLAAKKCIPCEGIGKALTAAEVATHLPSLPGWVLNSDGKRIYRDFTFKNFVQAVDRINVIKDIAEDQMHHPDLHLTSYKNLRVELYTHELGGVTENDLIVAAKINEVS